MDSILSRLEDFSRVSSLSDIVVPEDQTVSTVGVKFDSLADFQKEQDKAYQEGYKKAICDRELYWKSKNNLMQQYHDNKMADLRELFESCTTEAISIAVRDSFKCFSDSLEIEVAQVLKSILDISFSRKAAIEFSRVIIDLLKKGDCGKIVVHCPNSFHSLIEELLGEYSPMVCYEDSDTVEFSSKISGSIITTRLESWSSDVKKHIEIQQDLK
ncbi:hypothetical protein G293_03725 [Candidatus Liberibacter africanus PTSAPSY]|uniref:Flagellar assembly protein FliH/Type III secretion system HrpE domain-containing protein n=2 Tax=Liberibacter africanus TaxID=34020 RepID=A0A0G3I3A3_LIBAF|nr:hypothetical protein G293_03725 [Candidatus Liberibacter africanus PTSAPSY]